MKQPENGALKYAQTHLSSAAKLLLAFFLAGGSTLRVDWGYSKAHRNLYNHLRTSHQWVLGTSRFETLLFVFHLGSKEGGAAEPGANAAGGGARVEGGGFGDAGGICECVWV